MPTLTGWEWLAIIAAGCVIAWVYAQYANDAADTDWTDPQQPPDMLPLGVGVSCGRITRGKPYTKDYPGSLASWDGSVVGDC
jgi:hypothetical protein